jgi:hypothetical protein
VLAWRLGPEAVEEACRAVDPAGAEARAKALKAWEENNAALIKEVDEQVADVVPLAFPAPAELDSVVAVREQVKEMIVEPMVLGKAPEETAAICKAMADPTHPRWNSNGMPQVKLALSTLYDWQFRHTAK